MVWLMLFAVAAGLSALAGAYRLFVGPSATDRVIGLDLLFAVAIIVSRLQSNWATWVWNRSWSPARLRR